VPRLRFYKPNLYFFGVMKVVWHFFLVLKILPTSCSVNTNSSRAQDKNSKLVELELFPKSSRTVQLANSSARELFEHTSIWYVLGGFFLGGLSPRNKLFIYFVH
jgi:hypothetical protein